MCGSSSWRVSALGIRLFGLGMWVRRKSALLQNLYRPYQRDPSLPDQQILIVASLYLVTRHSSPAFVGAQSSQALAIVHPRLAVAGEIWRTSAVSSMVSSPKKRSSTIRACCGPSAASRLDTHADPLAVRVSDLPLSCLAR